jgi:hypothetical protein
MMDTPAGEIYLAVETPPPGIGPGKELEPTRRKPMALSKAAKKAAKNSPAFVCPECSRTDFKDARHLGVHRRATHGVAGISSGATKYHKRREQELAGAAGTAKPAAVEQNGTATVSPLAPKPPSPQPDAPQPTPLLVGYAVAKVENGLTQIATNNGIEPELLIAAVAAQLGHLAFKP